MLCKGPGGKDRPEQLGFLRAAWLNQGRVLQYRGKRRVDVWLGQSMLGWEVKKGGTHKSRSKGLPKVRKEDLCSVHISQTEEGRLSGVCDHDIWPRQH